METQPGPGEDRSAPIGLALDLAGRYQSKDARFVSYSL
jgi:hypothetical protein